MCLMQYTGMYDHQMFSSSVTLQIFTIYVIVFFFFNDTATTEIYTLSLHDALPISLRDGAVRAHRPRGDEAGLRDHRRRGGSPEDRKSTRLNSSHMSISYAVFCLKKKKKHPDANESKDSRSPTVNRTTELHLCFRVE